MKLRLGGAGKGFAQILGGGVGAQLVTFAILPLLSRLYTPADFGYFTLIIALVGLIAPAVTLRFETAAMLPEDTTQVRALVWNALLATVSIALGYGAVLALIAEQNTDDPAWRPLLPAWVVLSVILTGSFAIFSQLALRKQQYALVAKRTLLRTFVTAATQTGLGFLNKGADGLIIGSTLGSAAGIATMVRRTREYLPFPGWPAIRDAWRRFWRFPAVFAPSAMLNAAGLQVPLIFFTIWFGISVGGQLGMAERIASVPLTLLGVSIGQVLDAEISKRIRERQGGLVSAYLRISGILGALGLIAVLGMGLLAGWIVPWLLGEEWRLAGEMVQVLAITSGVRLVASPFSKFIILLQRSLANLIIDLLRIALLALTMTAVIVLDFAVVPALWLVYSGLSITYVITWVYALYLAKSDDATQKGTAME